MTQVTEDFIEHFGKKGMKWGVRKSRSQVKVSSDFKKTAPLRNRKTRELTNKQLQSVNARINMEQNYSRLNPSKVRRGQLAVEGVLAVAGTAAAVHKLLTSPAGQAAMAAGKAALKKKL